MTKLTSPWLVWALPLLAVLQVLAGSLHDVTEWGESIPDRSAQSETAAIPADYTFFVIWALIFLMCLSFAIYQALPAQRGNLLLARLRAPAGAAFLLNTVWQVNAQINGIAWGSFGLILALLAAALASVIVVNRHSGPISRQDLWLAVAPLHLLAGWISVAAFVSWSSTLKVTGLLAPSDSATLLAIGLVLAAASSGASITAKAREPAPYALAVAWGLAGVVVANVARMPNTAVAVAASVGIGLVLSALATKVLRGGGAMRLAGPIG